MNSSPKKFPPACRRGAAEDLKKLVTDRLVEAGLAYEGAKAFATPRRLALSVHGLPARQPDLKEERKGPRVGAPETGDRGFLKAAGLDSIDQAKCSPTRKATSTSRVIEKPGRPALEVIAEIVPEVIRAFPWPKSMRWGSGRRSTGCGRCIRSSRPSARKPRSRSSCPSRSTASPPATLLAAIASWRRARSRCAASTTTSPSSKPPRSCSIRRAARDMIRTDAKTLAFAQGLELIEDDGLLDEVAGLVEWPVRADGLVRRGLSDDPGEVIRATIRANQKCFVLSDPETAKLANKFILVANIEANDGGKAIVAGNERVIRARLSDAKFFYETDLRMRLEDRLPKFEQIVFHEKLGSQAERIARIVALAGQLAPLIGADLAKAERAAQLCKADLLTEVVGEFPELQGLMGRYYAQAQGEDEAVAHACEDHYKPQGPGRSGAGRPGLDRGRARRQARHAWRLLGHRREADRLEGPLRVAPRGARRDPPHDRQRIAAAVASRLWRHFERSRAR